MIKKSLRNGTNHPKNEIHAVVQALDALRAHNNEAFFELVKKCRFHDHIIPHDYLDVLAELGLFTSYGVRDVVKDVILSAVTGRTIHDLEVTSPLDGNHTGEILSLVF